MLDWHAEITALFPKATADELIVKVEEALGPGRHGDWPRWQSALAQLPASQSRWLIDQGILSAGEPVNQPVLLQETLKQFIPWRKGPLELGEVLIQTEWRSDWKWDRIAPAVDINGQRVLDIGAGNGYFGFQMLNAGASQVVGCDPTLLFVAQYLAIRHFSGQVANLLLPLKFEQIPANQDFDSVFSMGVLYHRKDPLEHLHQVRRHLRAGGQFVLETLTIPGDHDGELDPPERYANMRNVHRLPTVSRLAKWLNQAGFEQVRVIDQAITSIDEQKSTEWMPFHSLQQALTEDLTQTIEGYPPPTRTTIIADQS